MAMQQMYDEIDNLMEIVKKHLERARIGQRSADPDWSKVIGNLAIARHWLDEASKKAVEGCSL